ncbi:unnamed protein product [Cochlearia groenlandica]
MEISRSKNKMDKKTSIIVINHDFSTGQVYPWHPICCKAFLVTKKSGLVSHVVVTDRKYNWHGLEQDITSKVELGRLYKVTAMVSVSGPVQDFADIKATLKLKNYKKPTHYEVIATTRVFKEKWVRLEGMFSITSLQEKVIFYVEGPLPGINLLIQSVTIYNISDLEVINVLRNIIKNPHFEDGLNNWSGRCCNAVVHESLANGKILPQSGKAFASAKGRTQNWQGIQQEITGKIQTNRVYEVTAVVRLHGNNVGNGNVKATLWIYKPNNQGEEYIRIGNVEASPKEWIEFKGKFKLNGPATRVIIYVEGPPPGTDILLNSLIVKPAEEMPPLQLLPVENPSASEVKMLTNSHLSDNDTSNGWFPLGNCTISVTDGLVTNDSSWHGPHKPLSNKSILVTNRTQTWTGPGQVITDKLIKLLLTYQISVWVKLGSGFNKNSPQNVNVALGVDGEWAIVGQVEMKDDKWHEIRGVFSIENVPSKAIVSVHGPCSGVDIVVAGLEISPVHLRDLISLVASLSI